MKPNSQPDIVARMTDYFQRQIAWFDRLAEQWETVDSPTDPDQMIAFGDGPSSDLRQTQVLADEYWALKREWDAQGSIEHTDRESVRRLAQHAESISAALETHFYEGAKAYSSRAEALRGTLDDLRKGRALLAKYRTPDGMSPAYDRKA